jgi:hypothetical protein
MKELKARKGYVYTDKNKTFFADTIVLGNYRQMKIEGNEELIENYKNGKASIIG